MKKHICLFFLLILSFQGFSQRDYWKMIEKHPFGSISDRYTLTLTGYFDDCGEFGGHIETIELIRIEKKLCAIINIYEKNCPIKNHKDTKIIETKTYPVDDSKVILFQEYLNKLLAKSLEHYVPFHAGRSYSARLEFKKTDETEENDYNFQRINLNYHDTSSNWPEFNKLKSILMKK